MSRRSRKVVANGVVAAAVAAVVGVGTSPALGVVRINEVFIDAPGTNATQDFIELRSTTPGEDVSGLTLLLLEGDAGAASGSGSIDTIVTFAGVTGSNGLFLRHSFSTGPSPAIDPATTVQASDWGHENLAITYVLVAGFTGTPGQDLDTNDDGILETTPWTSVVNAVGVADANVVNDRIYGAHLGGADFSENVNGGVPNAVFLDADGVYHATRTAGVVGGPYTTPANGSTTAQQGFVLSPGNANNAVTSSYKAWQGAAGGNWSTGANWSSGVAPTAAGDIALLYGAGGSPINLDANVTLRTLSFNGGGHSVSGTNTLTMDTPTGNPAVQLHFGDASISAPIALAKTTTFSVARWYTLTVGDLAGAGGLTKNSNGTLLLTVPMAYTGLTTIGGGTISIADDALLGPTANALTINGGSATLPSTLTVTENETLDAARVVTMGSANAGFTAPAARTVTVASKLTGTGGLVANGPGTLVITGATNDYAGQTKVLAGPAGALLRLGADNALPATTSLNMHALSLADVPVFDMGDASNTGYNATVGGISVVAIDHDAEPATPNIKPTTPVITNSGTGIATLTVNNIAGNSFEGTITGNIALAKGGGGTLSLLNANTYVGGTTITGGVLLVSGGGALGAPGTRNVVNDSSLQVNNGHALQNVSGAGATLIGDGATGVTVSANHFRQNLLDVAANSTAAVNADPGVAGVSRVATLNLGTAAELDLKVNKLIVTTADQTGTWNGAAYDGLSGKIDTARGAAATWDGPGITTSDPRAVGQSELVSIGVARVADAKNIDDTATTTFGGQTVLGSESIAMVTWGGDANLDGKINIDDYGQIDSNVSKSGTVFGWNKGDFNYDGVINIDDYGIIDGNVGRQDASFSAAGAAAALDGVAAIPEPAGLALLALLPLLRRRRRHSDPR